MLKLGQRLQCQAYSLAVSNNRVHLEGAMGLRGASNLVLTFLFSGAIGTALPGAVYLSQKIRFTGPPLTASAVVQPLITVKRDLGKSRFLLQTELFQGDALLAEGEAIILCEELHD
jgi:hypothetical protein